MFTITCNKCLARAEYDPGKFGGVVDIMFEQGSLNVMDKMIIFCRKCGNKQEYGIQWPLNMHMEPTNENKKRNA
ncbi:hypothetical protein KAU11_03295 [Candidatus Babeliales bacterium]|nr:hypothetical protein [Candidatus Babeliales bacterium]